MTEVVIVDAVRTPIGRLGGALADVRPDDMVALVLQAIVERTGLDPAEVEEVYMGCANQAGEDNRNVARMGTLLAGFAQEVAAVTMNRLCASGLNAVNQAARAIAVGEGDVYVAGGVESMSRAPYSFPKNSRAWGPPGNITGFDTTLGWRYPNPKMEALFPLEAMGETAENIYDASCSGLIGRGEITRQEQDAFAFESQKRACQAINDGRFIDEIVPVEIPQSWHSSMTRLISLALALETSRACSGVGVKTLPHLLQGIPISLSAFSLGPSNTSCDPTGCWKTVCPVAERIAFYPSSRSDEG